MVKPNGSSSSESHSFFHPIDSPKRKQLNTNKQLPVAKKMKSNLDKIDDLLKLEESKYEEDLANYNNLKKLIDQEQTMIKSVDIWIMESKERSKKLQEQLDKLTMELSREKLAIIKKAEERQRYRFNYMSKKIDLEEMKECIEKYKTQLNYYKFRRNLSAQEPEECTLWFLKSEECVICMDVVKKAGKLNDCQHLVCEPCIRNMLTININAKCPLCRQTIKSYDAFDINELRYEFNPYIPQIDLTSLSINSTDYPTNNME